ncbi:MAG: rod shape-determining protein RodA [Bacteroidales bacterium]|nr:rod shape-determining protein RodA [Bacteroidales bacterium]
MSSNENSIFKSIDWFTIILYLVMTIYGAISIYAAKYNFDATSLFSFETFSGKQFTWIILSLCLGFSLLLIDRKFYEAYAYPIYGGMILLLILTIFIAPNVKGSHSWIVLGPVSLQPAEFAKFATALALAKLFSTYGFNLNSGRNMAIAVGIIMLPILIIIMQNETGSALVYCSLVFMLYREGMTGLVLFAGLAAVVIFVITLKYADVPFMDITMGEFVVFILLMLIIVGMLHIYCKSHFAARNVLLGYLATGALAIGAHYLGFDIHGYLFFFPVIIISLIYLVWEFIRMNNHRILTTIGFAIAGMCLLFTVNFAFNEVLKPHQQMRIKVALGIEDDIRGQGYNVNQSKIAIGSGGLLGKGFLNGTQTKFGYVPEQHTDFIYCTIGEEQGFVGSVAVLVLFLALILRVIAIAERQHTAFARVYAYCVASILIFHLSINVGMVLGLCPVIGIPLPFFSYGGSSLWGFTTLLFILLRIDASRSQYGVW